MLKNKYRTLILICFFLLVISFQVISAKELPLFQKVIVVDAGHGGRDPGTRYGNTLEKDLNLEIAKVLEKELLKQGAIVYMTRDEDEDLSNNSDYRKKRADLRRRVNFIEEKKSDLYLSIHLNWYKDYYYGGAEILYNNINKNNKVLATNLKESLTNNNIKTRDLKTTNLYMYRNTNVVGVLVECGFLSNKNDRYLLKTKWYQEKFSKALVEGVIKYFN
ncbi:MAG: N-acetylmuramoyl-L-alanine amidase [bacterium]|nr:N-acetylmuramoyl-L-alanine amidase [bacterium]